MIRALDPTRSSFTRVGKNGPYTRQMLQPVHRIRPELPQEDQSFLEADVQLLWSGASLFLVRHSIYLACCALRKRRGTLYRTVAQAVAHGAQTAWLSRSGLVSKTVGRGFESLRPCSVNQAETTLFAAVSASSAPSSHSA